MTRGEPQRRRQRRIGDFFTDSIPSDWKYSPLRWLSSIYAGGTPSKNKPEYWENGTIPWLASGEVNQWYVTQPTTHISEEGFLNSSAKWIPQGGLIVALAGQGKTKGMAAQLGISATCNQSLAAIAPRDHLHPRYLLYWLHSRYSRLRGMSGGDLRDGLNLEHLGSVPVPLPGFSEQRTIAAFLDHETARIDRLIEKQERLIELLKEKRQAVISHAVTKGLKPNAPMKDSGVEWMGEVPAHWAIERVASLFEERVAYGQPDLPVLSVSIHYGVTDKELTQEESDRKLQRIQDRSSYKVVRSGDLVYNMMRAWQGAFGAAAVDGLVSPAYVICKPISNSDTKYFELALRTATGIEEMRRFSKGITDFRLRLYWDEFRQIRLPVPPASEQEAILRAVRQISDKADSLTSKAREAIALLQERRAALISAAVTGKIDVRDWKPFETDPQDAVTA